MRIYLSLLAHLVLAQGTDACVSINVADLIPRIRSMPHETKEELCSCLRLHGKNSLERKHVMNTTQGLTSERLQQTYGGLEVVGGTVTANVDARGYTGIVSGEVYTRLNKDVSDPQACDQSAERVSEVAFKEEGVSPEVVSNIDVKKNVYVSGGIAVLTYEVNFFFMDGDNKPSRPCYFIDACRLVVVESFNNIQFHKRGEPLPGARTFPTRGTIRLGDDECGTGGPFPDTTTPVVVRTTYATNTTSDDECDARFTSPNTSPTRPPTTSPTRPPTPSPTRPPTTSPTRPPTTSPTRPPTTSPTRPPTTSPTRPPTTSPTRPPTTSPTQPPTSSTTTNPIEECINPATGVGGNFKTGKWIYGVPPFCLTTTVEGTRCILQNSYIKVVDLKQGTDRTSTTPSSYTCADGYGDTINGAYSAVLDAVYFGTMSVRMFIDWYAMTPLNFVPVLYVHYSSRYENAFWDGSSLTFGDGYTYFYPLVNQDVVGHEFAHGLTAQNSNLMYARQSGGINEAFSDITGETNEMFSRQSNDWLIGAEIFKRSNGALRYFEDPTDDRRSLKHVKDYTNSVDVHYSSGIFNHAFYQMVEVNSMPIRRAYECFLRANLMHWGRTTTFEQGACGVLKSCYELGFHFQTVTSSFNVVGITFSACPENSYMVEISDTVTRPGVEVSSSRLPVFKIVKTGQFTVTATSGSSINLDLFSDLSFVRAVSSGVDSLTHQSTSPLYLRLSAREDGEVPVSLRFLF